MRCVVNFDTDSRGQSQSFIHVSTCTYIESFCFEDHVRSRITRRINAESVQLVLVQQSQPKDHGYDDSGLPRRSFSALETLFTTNGYYLNMYLIGMS